MPKVFLNVSRDNQTSFWDRWSRMDAFGAKPLSQLRYTKIVHPLPKQKFSIFLLDEGFQKAPKDNQTLSNGVEWMHLV
jgi:hypothetical protein